MIKPSRSEWTPEDNQEVMNFYRTMMSPEKRGNITLKGVQRLEDAAETGPIAIGASSIIY